MAEWLRPRVFIAESGLNIRRISVGSISCPSSESIGWTVGDRKHVPSLLWLAYGRVVKAPSLHCRERTKYTPDKRGIEILSLKEVHRLGGW